MNYIKSIFDETGFSNIYGMVKNISTLNFLRLLLNKDCKINIFKNGFQILTILQEGNNSIGYRPSSPYTITFGVLVLNPKIFLTRLQMNFFNNVLVFKELCSLNTNKSTGLDEIPARFIKDGANVIKVPITAIITVNIVKKILKKSAIVLES
jgi:hypothetical protein